MEDRVELVSIINSVQVLVLVNVHQIASVETVAMTVAEAPVELVPEEEFASTALVLVHQTVQTGTVVPMDVVVIVVSARPMIFVRPLDDVCQHAEMVFVIIQGRIQPTVLLTA